MSIITLIVDDERALLEQSKTFLEKMDKDIEVMTASSAERALEMIDEKDFDVIVSDYQMPDIDGLEFLEEIRKEREDEIPFIMFTGKGREEVAMKALNLGADRYIQKGGDPKSQYGILAQAIKQESEHHRTKKEREKYTRELEFLNDLMVSVSRIESPDEICEYIADKVHSFNEDDYVIVSLYDREEETIRIRAVSGFDDYPQLVDELMHPDEEVTFDPDIQEEWSDIYSSGKLELMPEGLYSLVKGVLSKEEVEDIEDLLGVKKVYSVGFALDNKPYGGLTLLKTSEEDVKFSSAIETIASHLSVTLQRRQFKENLTKSEEKVKESEERYRRLFETAQDGMLIIDAETGIIEDANPFLQEILSYSKEEVVGKELWELGTFKSVVENKKRFEELTEEGYIRYEDMPLETKEGEEVPVEFISNTYEAGGKEVVQCNIRKISERKEYKQKLKRKERYLDYTPAFINVIDEEREIKYYSYPPDYTSGLDPSKVVGSEGVEFVHPDDREEVQEMFSKVFEDPGKEYKTELRGETEDGWMWLEVRAVNHLDDPKINGVIVTSQDISERKKTEKELKKREEKYRTMFESANDAIIILKEDSVVDCNEKALEMFGLDRDDIIGKHPYEFSPEKQPDGRDSREKAMEKINSALEGRPQNFEWLHTSKDGGPFPTEVTLTRYVINDERFVMAIVRDITHRMEAKERLEENKNKIERLQETSAELQSRDSEEEVYSFAINAAEEILDFYVCEISAPEDEKMKGIVSSSDFPEEASLKSNPVPLEGSVAGQTYLEDRSFLVEDAEKDQNANPTDDRFMSGMSIPIGDHAVFQALSTEKDHFDEEDLNMAELLMSHVSEALQRIKMKEREEFIHSLLRHDVGNKNQIIKGYLDLMKDHDLPDEVKNFVEKAEHTARDNEKMIEKIRKLRKIGEEEGMDEVDMNLVMDKVLSEHEDQMKEKDIKIDMDGYDCKVRAGPLLEELFSNLIENSILHSNCDEIRIDARTEDEEYVMTLKDDGSGISDDVKDKIFEKGFKSGETAGTGLGLYMVKEIVENYGGSVDVKDSDLGGVEFEVRLKKTS
ncbi:MAG: PAS domain S-box protein [Candidatus Thermoplasmatota archaeon]|nr:PAS domain S-box protein [Candidatus Thermoplasmatota archaeon]